MTAPPIPMRSDEQFVEELRERMDAKRAARFAVAREAYADSVLARAVRQTLADDSAFAEQRRARDRQELAEAIERGREALAKAERQLAMQERGPLRDCGDDTCTACAPKGAK